MSDHIWMQHDKTSGRAQLPDIPYWRAAGWEPCDGPPPEPDLTRDPMPDEPAQETTEPPESPGVLAVHDEPAAEPAQSEEG